MSNNVNSGHRVSGRFISWLALVGLCVFSGCLKRAASKGWEDAMMQSSVFRYVQSHAKKPMQMIDSEDVTHVYIELGDDLGFRFDNWYSMKIGKRAGAVEFRKLDTNGEFVWISDAEMVKLRNEK
jgi:hypothetical protein